MVLNKKALEVICNNQKSIMELSDNSIHIKNDVNEKIIKFNEIKDVDYIDMENHRLYIELNNEMSYDITPISMFDKIYLKDIYETINDYINFGYQEDIYTFEGVDIKESDNLLRIFDIYSNDTEYENVLFNIYDKGFIIKTNTFKQIINYDYVEFIEKKYGENEMIWDISLTGDNYIIVYFYIDDDNENVIDNAFNFIKSNILENPRSIQKDYPDNGINLVENNQFVQQQPPQQYFQPNYQQPMYSQPPMNKKSVLVAVILHILLIGLGYGYMNKWGKFLAVLFIAIICFLTSFLIIPAIIAIILWIYVLIDTIRMVNKYNNGQQY